jgi:RHS repeat-associated protein
VKKEIKVDSSGNLGTMIVHYDGLYRETQKETYDPEGTIYVDSQYDAKGRKWKVSNPRRSAETAVWTQFSYDTLDRPKITTAPDGSTVQYDYSGNQTTVTDEAGNSRRYTYDGLGRMTMVEEPNPPLASPLITTYTYNVLGKMTQSNQSGQTRSWAFDSLGRMTSETLPESGTTTFTYSYDANANPDSALRTKTDARGKVTTMSYGNSGGALHQLVSRSYSDSTPAVSFGYNSLGLRNSMTDGLGSVTYSYDSNTDKLTQESRSLTGVTGTFTTSYVYNIKGDLTSMTYPSGRAVEFKYATGGGCCNSRLEYVKDLTTNAKAASGLTFNAAGETLTRTLNPDATAIQESFTYNNRMQLTGITAAVSSSNVMNFTYNYGTSANNTGRVLSRTDAIQPEHSMVYSYDSIYRLSQATVQDTSWDISWGFDAWGNRTSQTPRGLATSKVGTQTIGYTNNRNNANTYDAAGNQTNDGLHNYTSNAENQITQMDGGTAAYSYDGEGRRMKKTVGSETTYYFYGPGGLLCEFSTSNTISSATAASSTDKTLYRTSDKLGSAVLVINSSGLVIENNRTLPYGEAWLAESTPSTNEKKFTTYQRDTETGLDYAMDRFYGNTTGRFQSPDTGAARLTMPMTLNRYIYGFNDPINNGDPTGREPCAYSVCVTTPPPPPPAPIIDLTLLAFASGGLFGGGGGMSPYAAMMAAVGAPPGPAEVDAIVAQAVQAAGIPQIFNSRIGGPGVYRALADVWNRLGSGGQSSTDCLNFLNSQGGDARALIGALIDNGKVGVGEIRVLANAASPGIGAATDPSAQFAFVINTEGGFFNQIAGVNPGGYGNQTQAQDYILLHELSHLLGTIQRDTGLGSAAADAAAQRANDNTINTNCGNFIRGRP